MESIFWRTFFVNYNSTVVFRQLFRSRLNQVPEEFLTFYSNWVSVRVIGKTILCKIVTLIHTRL